MPQAVDVSAPLCRLSPADGQFFFGYYDIPAADTAGRQLCHQVPFRDHQPQAGDTAVLGWLSLPDADGACDRVFHPFAETDAWNFQQGSMLQWLPTRPDTCLYNTWADGALGCCVHNLATGARQALPLAVANVALDGSKAICVNMPRIWNFRPGYGYEELRDPFFDVAAPAEDGVFLQDLSSGETRLLVSLAETVDFLASEGEEIVGQKVVINHITFNPSASRYLFLLRSFPEAGGRWTTWLLTADSNGGGLRHHNAYGVASHYHWRNDREMLFYMRPAPEARLELLLVDDDTDERTLIDTEYFLSDGHCSYSPSGDWMLYDSYPDGSTPDYLRALQVYGLRRRQGHTLGRFRAEKYTPETVDCRCDLHPRWMPDGSSITFDSIHEGYRGLYWMDLRGLMG